MFDHITMSRRRVIKVAVTGFGLAGVQAERAWAQQKMAKLEARYQDHPNGRQHCELCEYYITPVGCKLVRGEVSPKGGAASSKPRTG
jgi:hypothetical protein